MISLEAMQAMAENQGMTFEEYLTRYQFLMNQARMIQIYGLDEVLRMKRAEKAVTESDN